VQVSASPPSETARAVTEHAEGDFDRADADPGADEADAPDSSRGERRAARTLPPKAGGATAGGDRPDEGPASNVPLIEVKHARRSYGSVLAVKDVSFSVGRGEVVGFLGPNGAGKSTTLRMIVGYLGPSAGYVRVNGFDVVEQPLRARRAIGYMPETAPLYPEMRVIEYLAFRG